MVKQVIIDQKSSRSIMPSKWRVAVYLPEDKQKALEEWAAFENRSTSNLAATIIIKALEEYQNQKQKNT